MMRARTKRRLGLILYHLRYNHKISKKSRRFLDYIKKKYGSEYIESALKKQLSKKKKKERAISFVKERKELKTYHYKIVYSNKKDASKNFMLEVVLTYYGEYESEFNKGCDDAINELIARGHSYLGYGSFEVGIEDFARYMKGQGEVITDKCYNEFISVFEEHLSKELDADITLKINCLR